MRVCEIMTKEPHVLSPSSTVMDAAKMMKRFNCGTLPIGKDENVQGVITDRDIVTRGLAADKTLNEISVEELMSRNIIDCEESEDIKVAVHKMQENNIRRILVKNKDNKLTGILSLGDIMKKIEDKSLLASIFTETNVA